MLSHSSPLGQGSPQYFSPGLALLSMHLESPPQSASLSHRLHSGDAASGVLQAGAWTSGRLLTTPEVQRHSNEYCEQALLELHTAPQVPLMQRPLAQSAAPPGHAAPGSAPAAFSF
jgi:hypothetical protein